MRSRPKFVRVTGAVRQPISVPFRQGMTVLDAVLAAGGTNEFAAPSRTELYRKEGETLFRQGEPADAMYVVVRGSLQVLVDDRRNGPRRVDTLGR